MLQICSYASRHRSTWRADYHTDEDDDLVHATRGDPEAFGTLYDRYADRVYGYCFLRLRNREAAEDATSQVFLKALAGVASYHPSGHFSAWLFTIAHNVIVTLYHQQRSQRSLEVADSPMDPAPGPEVWALRHAEGAELYQAISLLPKDQRTVLELQLAGWTGSQIADVLGKSVPAVKMLRYRAVERLRSILDETGTTRQEQSNG